MHKIKYFCSYNYSAHIDTYTLNIVRLMHTMLQQNYCRYVHIRVHTLYMSTLSHTYSLITLPYGPKVMNIKLWLHILLTIVGNKWNLKRMVSHEIQSLSDLGHC